MGLVAELYQPGTVLENTVKVAGEFAQQSSYALCLAKEAICRGECLCSGSPADVCFFVLSIDPCSSGFPRTRRRV